MNSIIQITLGIVTAVGGFVDIGELVFSVQAGTKYGYSLLWAILVGTIGIIIFSEQAGRVAAVHKKAVFTILKDRFDKRLTLFLLIASTCLNIITCAAETGGVAIALQLLTGLSYFPSLFLTIGGLILTIWLLPFKLIERLFGILGMAMVVFVAALFARHIDPSLFAAHLYPTLPKYNTESLFTYFYFAIGIISSCMMPYEVYFYSSGGIEEKWSPKDLLNNKLTSIIGMCLGGIVSASLLILGADILKPLQIIPEIHGTAALLAAVPFGEVGLIMALFGILFAIAGAAIETCLAGAYNISQYFEWRWGRHLKPDLASKFSYTWILIIIFSLFVLLFQIDPIQLVEYAVIFSVLVLPFTYFTILKVSSDKNVMGKFATKSVGKVLGWFYFFLICIIAIAAIPLMVITQMGNS